MMKPLQILSRGNDDLICSKCVENQEGTQEIQNFTRRIHQERMLAILLGQTTDKIED